VTEAISQAAQPAVFLGPGRLRDQEGGCLDGLAERLDHQDLRDADVVDPDAGQDEGDLGRAQEPCQGVQDAGLREVAAPFRRPDRVQRALDALARLGAGLGLADEASSEGGDPILDHPHHTRALEREEGRDRQSCDGQRPQRPVRELGGLRALDPGQEPGPQAGEQAERSDLEQEVGEHRGGRQGARDTPEGEEPRAHDLATDRGHGQQHVDALAHEAQDQAGRRRGG